MSSRVARALLLALPLAACGPGEIVVSLPIAPAGIDRVAVLLTGADGQVISASGLVPVTAEAQRFEVQDGVEAEDVRGAWVIGHDLVSLPSGLRPDADTLSRDALTVVVSAGRQLGPPAWVARGERVEDTVRVDTTTAMAPAVSAPWLSRCPLIFARGRGVADLSCKEQTCPITVEQVGCTLVIDASSCTYGRVVAQISSDGALSVDPTSQLGACDAGSPGVEPGSLELSCDLRRPQPCDIVLYPLSDTPQFEVTEVVLSPRATTRSDFVRPPYGFVHGAAVTGPHLVVSELSLGAEPGTCRGVASELHVVDTRTQTRVLTATAPDCLVHLAPALSDGEVLGIYADAGWHVARFDTQGRMHGAVALELDAAAEVVGVTTDPRSASGPELMLVARTASGGVALLVDARTLAPRGRFDLGAVDPRSPHLTPAGFTVLDETNDQLGFYQRDTGVRTQFVDIRGNNPDEGMGRSLPFGGDYVVTAAGRLGGVKVARLGEIRADPARPYEDWVQPYGLAPWPADPTRLMVGLTGLYDEDRLDLPRDHNDAYVTLFDPERARVLPNMLRVGRGPVDHLLAVEGAPGLWLTLPWESKLVYVR
jgi:hypothetical protein